MKSPPKGYSDGIKPVATSGFLVVRLADRKSGVFFGSAGKSLGPLVARRERQYLAADLESLIHQELGKLRSTQWGAMTLGTAIFLSFLFLALVILYGLTKDRWAWRSIAMHANSDQAETASQASRTPSQEFCDWVDGELRKPIPEPQSPLYHYTSMKGLKGILKTRSLRLTTVFGQGDRYEILAGMRCASEQIEKQINRRNPREVCFRNLFRDKLQLGAPTVTESRLPDAARFFLICFALGKNIPRMWRDYADKHRGFCLEFDKSAAVRFLRTKERDDCKSSNGSSIPARVNYSRQKIEGIFSRASENALKQVRAINSLPLRPQGAKCETLKIAICMALFGISESTFHKSAKFNHEREWRFLRIIRFDRTPCGMSKDEQGREFVSWSIEQKKGSKNLLRRIIVGPHAPCGTVRTVKRLLKCNGLRVPVVRLGGRCKSGRSRVRR